MLREVLTDVTRTVGIEASAEGIVVASSQWVVVFDPELGHVATVPFDDVCGLSPIHGGRFAVVEPSGVTVVCASGARIEHPEYPAPVAFEHCRVGVLNGGFVYVADGPRPSLLRIARGAGRTWTSVAELPPSWQAGTWSVQGMGSVVAATSADGAACLVRSGVPPVLLSWDDKQLFSLVDAGATYLLSDGDDIEAWTCSGHRLACRARLPGYPGAIAVADEWSCVLVEGAVWEMRHPDLSFRGPVLGATDGERRVTWLGWVGDDLVLLLASGALCLTDRRRCPRARRRR